MKRHVLFTLAFICMTAIAGAQIIHVPDEFPSIQAGIDTADIGDTVLVSEGTYFENINFRGMAITVASQFILDGDTSHVSKTIIDGSQYTNSARASTVLMESGEDTTSVLVGFTITGGEGSIRGSGDNCYGAGINIMNSGGKVLHNIITGNHLASKPGFENYLGGGINASVNGNHTAIIRKNVIIDNSVMGAWAFGAGISIDGGRCIVEFNTIKKNKLEGETIHGAGIFWFNDANPGTIEEVIIRNNLITENEGIQTDGGQENGGAIATGYRFPEGIIEIYNNIISYNFIEGESGGFYSWENPALVYNNTFYNNTVKSGWNHIYVGSGKVYVFNNVVWSDLDNGNNDINSSGGIVAYSNLLTRPVNLSGVAAGKRNVYMEPAFKSERLDLAENSPGIGRGIDSIWFDSTWYKVPPYDFLGNPRPAAADQHVDIGAIESDHERQLLGNADLFSLEMYGHSMVPRFHEDTLNYLLVKNPGNKIIGDWRIYPVDNLAMMEMDTAADLLSENVLDRTSTIQVTSSDGTTQKEYTVVYNYLTSVATLASLEVSLGELDPSFDPSVISYYDTIPYGVGTPVPKVTCIATDTSATVTVKPASNIYDRFEALRTTTISVTSPNDQVKQEYTILFTVDMTRPEMTILQDSVILGEEFGVLLEEPGQVYLVPENTAGIHDSLENSKMAWTEGSADTVFISTEGLDSTGKYWVYTIGRYQSISESQEITIYSVEDPTKVRENDNERFRLFPNPAHTSLTIEAELADHYSIEITILNGQQILGTTMEGTTHQLDLSSLQKGVYVITIKSMNHVTRRKIIKLDY